MQLLRKASISAQRGVVPRDRRGAAAIEFAVVAPMLMMMVLGVVELGRTFDVSQVLYAAAREGARLGAMDRTGIVASGQSNAKVAADIKNFLTAAGLPGSQATVTINKEPMDGSATSNQTFNLDDPANAFQLYRISVSVPASAVSISKEVFYKNSSISASIVFRSAKATISN